MTENETYPWDRSEPYVPPLSASLIVVPTTPMRRFDHEGNGSARVIGIGLGEFTLHLGLHSDDEAIEVIDLITEQLREVRDGIDRRLSEPLATADEVLGILAEPAITR